MDLFFAMGGILMSVALARLYAKYELRFLNHLSPTSYTIYLYHGIFQVYKLLYRCRNSRLERILALISGISVS